MGGAGAGAGMGKGGTEVKKMCECVTISALTISDFFGAAFPPHVALLCILICIALHSTSFPCTPK